MNVLGKRILAVMVDYFIFGSIISCIQLFIPNFLQDSKFPVYLILIPFFFRDLIFRNCGIGKKMFGLSVYDTNWKRPTPWQLIKRAFITNTVGFVKLWVIFLTKEGSKYDYFVWELNTVKMTVVDNKTLREIEAIAREREGKFEENISVLYDMYLKDIYMK